MTPHQEPAPTRCQTGTDLLKRWDHISQHYGPRETLAAQNEYLSHVNRCQQCAAWRQWSQKGRGKC